MNAYFISRELRRAEVLLRVHSQFWFRGSQQGLSNTSDGSFRFNDHTIYRKGKAACLRTRKSFAAGRLEQHGIVHKCKRDRPFLQQFGGN